MNAAHPRGVTAGIWAAKATVGISDDHAEGIYGIVITGDFDAARIVGEAAELRAVAAKISAAAAMTTGTSVDLFIAPDAYDDPTVWRVNPGASDQPIAEAHRSKTPTAIWAILAAAIHEVES